MPDREALRIEGRLLGRLVLGREPEPEFVERYVGAHEFLFQEPVHGNDGAVMALAVRRPWLVPCLDSAAALVRPHALLHRKALLMAAILEASPRYAGEFLPRRTGWAGLVWLGFSAGLMTAVRVAVGIPVLILAGRGGNRQGARP